MQTAKPKYSCTTRMAGWIHNTSTAHTSLLVMPIFFLSKSTVDEEEIEKLSRPTSDWWNTNGDFAALHSMNKLRVSFIKKSLEHLQAQSFILSKPLKGFRILDVGCGGGILSEVRSI